MIDLKVKHTGYDQIRRAVGPLTEDKHIGNESFCGKTFDGTKGSKTIVIE